MQKACPVLSSFIGAPKRQLAKKERKIDWREVRVGFARPVNDRQKRTFMARMDKYPVVVEQLVSAAIDQGMGKETEVTAVADGGNGLREALEVGFPKLKFIQGPHSSQTTYLSNC